MTEYNDGDDNLPENEGREHSLEEDAAPDSVGVYDRPEQTAMSPTLLAVITIVLLLVGAVTVYALVF